MLPWTLECMYLFKFTFLRFGIYIYPGIELWLYMAVLILVFLTNLHTVFHMAAPIYIPTSSVWEFLFLHILTDICYLCSFLMIAILTDVKWYLMVVLIFTSLMISNIKNMSCVHCPLLATCIFLWKNIYSGLPNFWLDYWRGLILSSMRYLFNLGIKPLSVIIFASIFSHSVGCLFTFLMFLLNSCKSF